MTDIVEPFGPGIQAALEAQPPAIAAPHPVFDGQLPSVPSAALKGTITDPSTPMDIKMGLTEPADVAHPLRWGFMTAGRICKDMVGSPPPPAPAAAIRRCFIRVAWSFIQSQILRNARNAEFSPGSSVSHRRGTWLWRSARRRVRAQTRGC